MEISLVLVIVALSIVGLSLAVLGYVIYLITRALNYKGVIKGMSEYYSARAKIKQEQEELDRKTPRE